MKISEIIQQLQKAQDALGDLEVIQCSDIDPSWWYDRINDINCVPVKQSGLTHMKDIIGYNANDNTHTHIELTIS